MGGKLTGLEDPGPEAPAPLIASSGRGDVPAVFAHLAGQTEGRRYSSLAPRPIWRSPDAALMVHASKRFAGRPAQRLGHGPEQDVVNHDLVLEGDAFDLLGQREDDVEVRHAQAAGGSQKPSSLCEPRRTSSSLPVSCLR
jgi:hypothetical protein